MKKKKVFGVLLGAFCVCLLFLGRQAVVKADLKLAINEVKVNCSGITSPYTKGENYLSVSVGTCGYLSGKHTLGVTLCDSKGIEVHRSSKTITSQPPYSFFWDCRQTKDGTLIPNGEYKVKVSLDGVEAKEYEKSVTVLTYPAAPKLKVESVTSQSAKLSWKKVQYASGYMVQLYKPDKKAFVNFKQLGSNSSCYTYANFMPTTKYQLRVLPFVMIPGRVNRYYSEKSFSNTVSFKTKNYLSTPFIKVKKLAKTSIRISWKKNSNAKGYIVYMSTSKRGKYKKIAALSKNTRVSFVKKKLKRRKKYYFKVRSYVKIEGSTFYSADSTVKYAKL